MTAVNNKDLNNPLENEALVIAQFSDSHLFAELDGLHHNVNVLNNLKQVLSSIAANSQIDYAIFTGDLTQDHSEQSYINFAEAVWSANICVPVFFLAGNHDEPVLLNKHLAGHPFVINKKIDESFWQIHLIDSKSDTPAGLVSAQTLNALPQLLKSNKHQLLMMHHHPIDVGYFIDNHGLKNKDEFWRVISTCNKNNQGNIKAIACGHVHRASKINARKNSKAQSEQQATVDLYTCSATSIQFDPTADTVSALAEGPAYRLFYLQQNGTLSTELVHL